jgi:hypothetical protein
LKLYEQKIKREKTLGTDFMKTISHIGQAKIAEKSDGAFAIDTTFVLFFLALEFGQSFRSFSIDSMLMMATLALIAIAPYFLATDKLNFKNWLFGRGVITVFAMLLGWMFKQSLGVVLPEMFRFLPMTLLIVTAMLSCYIQFYSFLKLRLVK